VFSNKKSIATNGDSDSDSDSDIDELPLTHQIVFRGHDKAASSVSADGSGGRFVTGSNDCSVKFWDFAGMDSLALNAFRMVEPVESHQIRKAIFSPSSEFVLAIPRYTKPKLYTRDGNEVGEFVAGDMYLVDMKNTKGHTAEMTDAEWNPAFKSEFATCAHDSTVRIWDATRFKSQKSVIVVRTGKGVAKNRLTSLAWSKDGTSIYTTTMDGGLSVWDTKGSFLRPSHAINHAHKPGSLGITGIATSIDGNTVISRGGDDGTVKMWDRRRFTSPVMMRSGLVNLAEGTNIVFSPDERYVVTGTSLAESAGKLEILDRSDLTSLQSLEVAPNTSVTCVSWHPKLNQIFAGLSNGHVHVLFSPELSTKGGKLVIERTPKIRHVDDNPALTTNISIMGLNEEALEFEDANQRNRRKNKNQTGELVQPKVPERGVWGVPNKDHVDRNVHLSSLRAEDPRDALLKFAGRAEKDPRFTNIRVDKKIFADIEEPDDDKKKTKKLRIGK
jgi:WD40 repeat protein